MSHLSKFESLFVWVFSVCLCSTCTPGAPDGVTDGYKALCERWEQMTSWRRLHTFCTHRLHTRMPCFVPPVSPDSAPHALLFFTCNRWPPFFHLTHTELSLPTWLSPLPFSWSLPSLYTHVETQTFIYLLIYKISNLDDAYERKHMVREPGWYYQTVQNCISVVATFP